MGFANTYFCMLKIFLIENAAASLMLKMKENLFYKLSPKWIRSTTDLPVGIFLSKKKMKIQAILNVY